MPNIRNIVQTVTDGDGWKLDPPSQLLQRPLEDGAHLRAGNPLKP
jgi:hypothetical protein